MQILQARNVNGLYAAGLELLLREGVRESSRAGDVLVLRTPVTSVYDRPMERVLFDEKRGANPFFHLFEALWMLAGRDDARFLDQFVKDFGARFAEPDGRVHGAYGHRWRRALGFDQLDVVVEKLRANPDDRQAVIQMWDASYGCPAGECNGRCTNDLRGSWRDRPCNTQVYLRVRMPSWGEARITWDARGAKPEERDAVYDQPVLDLTVCCRSNDVVWGAYGANAVHFSVLQEYLAGRIGCQVGRMYQFSNNWHGYVDVLDKIGDPKLYRDKDSSGTIYGAEIVAYQMGHYWEKWDDDLATFMKNPDGLQEVYFNIWFPLVAVPMFRAHRAWREARYEAAQQEATKVAAPDWRAAALQWLRARAAKTPEVRSA